MTSGAKIIIHKLHFSQIIYDEEDVEFSKEYVITAEKLDLDNSGGFLEIPQEFVDNFILGLTDFSTDSMSTVLVFNWNFVTIASAFGV